MIYMRKKIVRSYKIDPIIKAEFDALARRIASEVPKMDMGDVVGGALLAFLSLPADQQIEYARKTWDYEPVNHGDTKGTEGVDTPAPTEPAEADPESPPELTPDQQREAVEVLGKTTRKVAKQSELRQRGRKGPGGQNTTGRAG